MANLLHHLPADVLLHVFTYLPAADKFNVRVCCKYFDQLVSHRSLWEDYTACFSFKNGRYNPQFWTSLARRGLKRAVVLGGLKEKHWIQLASTLPSLSTLVVDNGIEECARHLNKFPKLRSLALRANNTRNAFTVIKCLTVVDPELMTCISLCNVDFLSPEHFLAFLSQFTNLTSLEYHSAGDIRNQVQMFHCIISGLPKLKHFSWAMNNYSKYVSVPEKGLGEPADCFSNQTLTSLELVVYDDSCLSNDTMRSLTRLQSLTVVYMGSQGHRLKTWLSHVPQLSTLVIKGGPPSREYGGSIPAKVTSLTMRVNQLTSADLAVIASKVQGLLHLHLEPWPSDCHTGMIFKLFPNLKSIKLRIWQIGEKNFLDLHRFRSMQRIEVMDDSPRIAEISRQLQTLNDKIRILTSSGPRDPWACYHH
uniref:F-box domain-containing protein n=1 Tax=Gadus morhua TaxID=8049 RepID=A0A8C5FLW7_GADMO